MSYSDIVATIAMIVSITAVPASGYFSYHFAIKGEKRKEFNAISDVIRQKLREQLRLVKNGVFPGGGFLLPYSFGSDRTSIANSTARSARSSCHNT